jgi:hypothetical protein
MTDDEWTARLNDLLAAANAKDAEIARLRATIQRIADEIGGGVPADEVYLDHAPGPDDA